jgi:hypothetical protein
MTTPHTSALDHALAEALHEIDVIQFRIAGRDENGRASEYDADGYFSDDPGRVYMATAETPLAALNRLMTAIRALKRGAS